VLQHQHVVKLTDAEALTGVTTIDLNDEKTA
jgi:hypothetical protein